MEERYEIPIPGIRKPAVARLFEDVLFNCWWITGISVPRKAVGRGYGRALLKTILEEADASRVELRLFVWANDHEGLPKRELMAWYRRHGFVWISKETYRRKPCGKGNDFPKERLSL